MADGRFFLHNMFTTDPQNDLEFSVFFWLLGRVMAVTHCSPQAALQFARLGGRPGPALADLPLLPPLSAFRRRPYARLTAFGFACLSSGLGWVQWHRWQDKNLPGGPVDAWQPEAYTFLSIYTSALMTVSTLLILGALYALLLGEQTRKWKYPIIAGVCGGILGNMHSYDVLHLSAAWGLFLIVLTIVKRGKDVAMSWAAGHRRPSPDAADDAVHAYVFNAEAVFKARANVPTLSPSLPVVFWAPWICPPLALLPRLRPGLRAGGAASVLLVRTFRAAKNRRGVEEAGAETEEGAASSAPTVPAPPELALGVGISSSLPLLFALCWAVAGLLIAYFPMPFQRKMLMGEHLPLCLLAGVGAAWLARRFTPRHQALALALLVLASAPSTFLFLRRDFRHLETLKSETHLTPYPLLDQRDVYDWLRAHTPPSAAVVGLPGLCTFLPGEAGRAVWAGHWAETPQYGRKDAEFADAFDQITPDDYRHQFLLSTRAQYLFYPNDISLATFKRHHRNSPFRATYSSPASVLEASLQERHVHRVRNSLTGGNLPRRQAAGDRLHSPAFAI